MYIFFFIIFIVFCMLYILPLKIKFNFLYDSNNSKFKISITSFFGLIKYDYENSISYISEKVLSRYRTKVESKTESHKLKMAFQYLKSFVMKYVKIYEAKLKISLGLDDAFITAIISSLISITCGCFISYINNRMIFNLSEMRVVPVYNCIGLSISSTCIIETKIGYIINVLFKIILNKPKRDV